MYQKKELKTQIPHYKGHLGKSWLSDFGEEMENKAGGEWISICSWKN